MNYVENHGKTVPVCSEGKYVSVIERPFILFKLIKTYLLLRIKIFKIRYRNVEKKTATHHKNHKY